MDLKEFDKTLSERIKEVNKEYKEVSVDNESKREFVLDMMKLFYNYALEVDIDIDCNGEYTLYLEKQMEVDNFTHVIKAYVDFGNKSVRFYKYYGKDFRYIVEPTEKEMDIFRRLFQYIVDAKNVNDINRFNAECKEAIRILEKLNEECNIPLKIDWDALIKELEVK